jgi:UDP-N-acetylglucosamine 1-carboxyvinyltransferase
MEDAYIIQGGKKLSGEISLSGAKNVALKVIIAGLMFEGPVILENIPRIKDVVELINLLHDLGGKAEFIAKNKLVVDGSGIKKNRVDLFHASKIRVSFMLFAPLLAKFGKCYIPNPEVVALAPGPSIGLLRE